MMSIAQGFLAEFEQQAPFTRRFLERVPGERLTWRPHARSMTVGQLALHIAASQGSIARAVQAAIHHAPSFGDPPQPADPAAILTAFDESVITVRQILSSFDDEAMNATWQLMAGGKLIVAMPRCQFLRNTLFSHIYQHRGQLSVYLRLLDVPVPATWGPSADEPPHFPEPISA